MPGEFIDVRVDAPVATVTINREGSEVTNRVTLGASR